MFKGVTINRYMKISFCFLGTIFLLAGANTVILFMNRSISLSPDFLAWLKYSSGAETLLGLASVLLLLFVVKTIYPRFMESVSRMDELIAEQHREIAKQEKSIESLTNLYNNTAEYDRLKTEFFSNISHELKTPLSIILGAIQLMEQKKQLTVPDQARWARNLQIIKQNCHRLLRLVNNILDITRIDSGYVRFNPSNCNIVYLVEEIMQSVIPYAEQKRITLEFDTEEEEIVTAVDEDKIERIILNLLSNAMKFTDPGGSISVNVRLTDCKVLISVKDTGCGIPPDMFEVIFERFRQVNSVLTRQAEGSGIGLSLVKGFVELHGGSITVNSEENQGSEFIIELPLTTCDTDLESKPRSFNGQSRIIEAIKIEFSDIYTLTPREKKGIAFEKHTGLCINEREGCG